MTSTVTADATIRVNVTRFSVSRPPYGPHDTITVELASAHSWAVRASGECLSKSGEWDYEPFPSSRTDEWLAEHRFAKANDAIDAAKKALEGKLP